MLSKIDCSLVTDVGLLPRPQAREFKQIEVVLLLIWNPSNSFLTCLFRSRIMISVVVAPAVAVAAVKPAKPKSKISNFASLLGMFIVLILG